MLFDLYKTHPKYWSHHSGIRMWHFKMAAIFHFHKFDLLTYFQFGGSIMITLQTVPGVLIFRDRPNFQGEGHKVKVIFYKY